MSENHAEQQIIDKYERLRRQFQDNYRVRGTRHDIHWRRAAEVAAKAGAPPGQWVEAQFRLHGTHRPNHFPFPNQLYSEAAAARWEEYREKLRPMAEEELTQQFRYLSSLTESDPRSSDFALLDERNPFRPFFRLLGLSDAAYQEAKIRWGPAARAELQQNPEMQELILKIYGYRAQRIVWEGVSGAAPGAPFEVPPAHPAR